MGSLCKPQKLTTSQNASTTALQPYAGAYEQLLNRGLNVSNTAYNPATNAGVAGFAAPQEQAFQSVQNMQGSYQPYLNAAAASAFMGTAPTYDTVGNYMNPYTQNVTNALLGNYDEAINRNRQMTMSDAARAGALTGDRRYIAQNLNQQQMNRDLASALAQTQQRGYETALGAAQSDATRQLAAAQGLGALAEQAQRLGYGDISQLMGIGNMQQAQQQRELDTATQNALRQSAYPFETAQWAANYAQGLGGAAGSQSTGQTTQPGPSYFQQILGAAAAAAGAAAKSDARIKHNIEEIGSTHDGQPIYRYRMEDSPKTEIGLLAQNVEKTHPEAVSSLDGIKHVNYKMATEDSVRPKYALGGAMPYGGGLSYVPQIQIQQRAALPKAQFVQPAQRESGMNKMLENFTSAHDTLSGLGKLGENLSTPISTSKDPSSGFETTTYKSGWAPWLENQLSSAGKYLGGLFGYGQNYSHGGPVRHGYQYGGVLGGMGPFDYYPSYVPDNSQPVQQNQVPEPEVLAPEPIETDNSNFSTFVEPSGLGGLSKSTTAEPQGNSLFGLNISPEAADALMAAGFGMMASNSPFAGQAIGEGGLAGLAAYQRAMRLKQDQQQGTIKEVDGNLLQVLPNGKVKTLYQGAKSPFVNIQKLDDGTVIGITKDGQTQVIYGGGGVGTDKTFQGRSTIAERYGLTPEETKTYALTGKLPKDDQGPLTTTDKKAILEADEQVSLNQGAIENLQQAKLISSKAKEGLLASQRGYAQSFNPLADQEAAKATLDLDNLIIGNALGQLRTLFGANPTEGERGILLELQGSTNLPHETRVRIYDRAIKLAERRLKFNQDKAAALRGGTYYRNNPYETSSPAEQAQGQPQSSSNSSSSTINFGGGFSGGFTK